MVQLFVYKTICHGGPAVFETIAFLSTLMFAGVFTLLFVMNRRAANEDNDQRP